MKKRASYKAGRLRIKRAFHTLMKQYESVFYYGCEVDRWLPEMSIIPFVTLGWHQVPVWCRIIAPPSSGKSAHLSLLDGYVKTYMLDEFTTKCFVSGFRGQNEDPSKLPQMDGKVLIITDESTIMQQRAEERGLIQSILRKAYDGSVSKAFGNIKEVVKHEASFNMLCASTPIIDRYYTYNQALGERFINFRLQIPNRKELSHRAIYNQRHQFKRKHHDLKSELHLFLRSLPKTQITNIKLPKSMEDIFVECADFIALIRTHVARDHTGRQVVVLPQAEVSSRLVQQMVQVASADAIINGDRCIDESHAEKAVYTALCSMPTIKAFVLFTIYNRMLEENTHHTIQDVVIATGIGRQTIQQVMEDFAIHRVLRITRGYKQGGRAINYQLSESAINTIADTGLFRHYMPLGKKQKNIIRKDRWMT